MKNIFGKLKGPFRTLLHWPIYSAIFVAFIDVGAFFINVRAGLFVLIALILYMILFVVFYITMKNFFIANLCKQSRSRHTFAEPVERRRISSGSILR